MSRQVKKDLGYMLKMRWIFTLVLVIVALVGGVFLGSLGLTGISNMWPGGVTTESRSTQIINAVQREEQVVLLGLSIHSIETQSSNRTLPGLLSALGTVPFSERESSIPYTLTTKLGIEGKDVEVRPVNETHFIVSIPEFIFIGNDGVLFETATEKNGVFSWVTPEIDQLEMANRLLSGDQAEQYIAMHEEVLKDQAKNFYTRIISGIDPEISVEMEYR